MKRKRFLAVACAAAMIASMTTGLDLKAEPVFAGSVLT